MARYLRISSSPTGDLATGHSYTCGAHGDEDQAHAGLSGYSLDELDPEDAVEKLDDLLGVCGPARTGAHRFLTVFAGSDRGVGPDGESLFAAYSVVASIDTCKLHSVDDAIAWIERMAP